MKYELASSSTEEGEVQGKSFPYQKSHLRYYYYPQSTIFIGQNSIPNGMDYKIENNVSQKIKKELKSDYPFLQFNLIDNHRLFFDNKFKKIGTLEARDETIKLISTQSNLIEIKNFLSKSSCENLYEKFYQRIFFKKDLECEVSSKINKIFCLEDRMLSCLDKDNAFVFFRVSSEYPVQEEEPNGFVVKKYAFEDVFFNHCSFYEMLDLIAEKTVKSFNSEEIKTFTSETSLIYIYSSTTFNYNGKEHRIYNNIDSARNTMILFNKTSVSPFNIDGRLSTSYKYLISLDLPNGDYVINNKTIYKMSIDGEQFQYKGFNYEGFDNSRQ